MNTQQGKTAPGRKAFFELKFVNKKTKNSHNLSFLKMNIHVYSGGIDSYPSFTFNSALQKVIRDRSATCKISATVMTIADLRKSGWSESQFADWLLDCDIHMILAHPHQGTETFQWDVVKLYKELTRLYHHVGFPYREQLLCPIFTQNKFSYLEPLRIHKVVNPTLRITVRRDVEEYAREFSTYLR
jgi:hypothetical protein